MLRLLPLASRGFAFLTGYVGTGLSGREEGETEAEEQSDYEQGLGRCLSLRSDPAPYKLSGLVQSLCALVSLSIKWG